MRTGRRGIAAAAIVCSVCATLWALGSDLPAGKPVKSPTWQVTGRSAETWPAGLEGLANSRPTVHGYFVNDEDVLLYAGDTKALNEFVKQYADTSGIEKDVVLRVGPKKARSPWDHEDRDIEVNWSLYIAGPMSIADRPAGAPLVTRIDVWLGGAINLAKVEIPDGVKVTSGGEIDAYVAGREKKAK
jgi:hypothetical protein